MVAILPKAVHQYTNCRDLYITVDLAADTGAKFLIASLA